MERNLDAKGNRGQQKTITKAGEAKQPKKTTAARVEKVRDQGNKAMANKEPKQHATFVDLEKGPLDAQAGEADTGGGVDTTTGCANLCIFVLYCIIVIAAAALFTKISVWPAVGLTSFMVGMASW